MKTQIKRKKTIRAALAAVMIMAAAAALAAVIVIPQSCAGRMPQNTVNSPGDAAGKKIGVLSGTAAAALVTDAGALEAYNSAPGMMADLKSGAVDCAVIDKTALKSVTGGVSGVRALDEPYFSEDFSFVIARENADLTKAVNAALAKLGSSGVLKNIADGYLGGSKYKYVSPPDQKPASAQLKLAVPPDFPPYVFQDDNGDYTGIDIDVARAVCDILGVDFTVVPEDRSEIVPDVQTGKADFAAGGFFQNDADAAIVDFTNPYASCALILIVRK